MLLLVTSTAFHALNDLDAAHRYALGVRLKGPLLVAIYSVSLAACGGSPDIEIVSSGAVATDAPATEQYEPEEAPATSSSSAAVTEPAGASITIAATSLPDRLVGLDVVFDKHVDVSGISIVATTSTPESAVIHAANVMAQYLDKNADGAVDDQRVLDALIANNATLVMANDPDELESLDARYDLFDQFGDEAQDLYAIETNPAGGFDAALEEIHHLLLNFGWADVHPGILGQDDNSAISAAMDLARGGHFTEIPDSYPAHAWFTYDDWTCDYTCQLTEYTYWAHTSLLGAQVGRDDVTWEWRLITPEAMRGGDPAGTAILSDPALQLPSVLPDGNYSPA